MLTRSEQIHSGLYADLGPAHEQMGELVVRQTVEHAERTQVAEAHQTVAK